MKPNDQGLIASAGKWLYGAYALERSNLPLDPVYDIPYLNMTSGYDALNSCTLKTTVAACGDTTAQMSNNPQTAADVGKFYYDSGHFEAHAQIDWSRVDGLGPLNKTTLSAAIAKTLNIDNDHSIPNPAGTIPNTINVGHKYVGVVFAGDASMDANTYTVFLRQLLNGTLKWART